MHPLRLRPAHPEDAELIARWLCKPDLNRFLAEGLRGKSMNAPLIKVALRRPDQAWFLFSAHPGDAAEAAPLGLIALDKIEPADGVANIWYVLGEPTWAGRSVTTAALQAFCARNPASLHVVTAWAAGENPASIRCLEKAGFQALGTIPDAFVMQSGDRCARHLYYRSLRVAEAG